MANIMMTDACNLKCPYCFANEFVNKDKNEISEEAFVEAKDFILGDKTRRTIGLIGGEPTLHSKFDKLLRILIRDERAESIVIYTNGVFIDKYWDIITHKKVHLLINCNSPKDIGENAYKKICDNLETLLIKKEFIDNVTLGINMYKEDFEYDYILDLLKKYNYHHVRVSITVPNIDDDRNTDGHEWFMKMKPRMIQFFKELMDAEIIPNFDCNKIPSCLIEENEFEELKEYLKNEYIRENIIKSNISNKCVRCSPVIDIRQDLTAVRCFGLSEISKQSIKDFKCIRDLENYYMRTIDAYAFNTVYSEKCSDCYDRKVLLCNGGCLSYKIKDILELQKASNDIINKVK